VTRSIYPYLALLLGPLSLGASVIAVAAPPSPPAPVVTFSDGRLPNGLYKPGAFRPEYYHLAGKDPAGWSESYHRWLKSGVQPTVRPQVLVFDIVWRQRCEVASIYVEVLYNNRRPVVWDLPPKGEDRRRLESFIGSMSRRNAVHKAFLLQGSHRLPYFLADYPCDPRAALDAAFASVAEEWAEALPRLPPLDDTRCLDVGECAEPPGWKDIDPAEWPPWVPGATKPTKIEGGR